jgi:hypothetical protein
MRKEQYSARAARKPLHFWFQPFALLLLIAVLWYLLPSSALLFKTRIVQPLPDARVSYVKIDSVFATEILRVSMQAWRRSAFGDGSTDNGIIMSVIEPYVPLGPPVFLSRSCGYSANWVPSEVQPLQRKLPDLLCTFNRAESIYQMPSLSGSQGVRIVLDQNLEDAAFKFVGMQLSDLRKSGSCRVYVETEDDGSVAHVLILESSGQECPAEIERALSMGQADGAARGQIEISWRKQ